MEWIVYSYTINIATDAWHLCFQNDVNCYYSRCHSEKTENLATSVDFRLIQKLSMLIKHYCQNSVLKPIIRHLMLLNYIKPLRNVAHIKNL